MNEVYVWVLVILNYYWYARRYKLLNENNENMELLVISQITNNILKKIFFDVTYI